MDTDPYTYDDLVLVETFVLLQQEVDKYVEANPDGSTVDKYRFLCNRQGHKTSPAYLAFLDEASKQQPNDKAPESDVNKGGSAESSGDAKGTPDDDAEGATLEQGQEEQLQSSEGHLSFTREYMGNALLLPILVTLPDCAAHLRSIDLSSCHLNSAVVQLACLKVLVSCTNLQSINISDNPKCGSIAIEALLQLAKRRTNILHCDIRDTHSIAPLNRRLAEALGRNKSLQEVK